MRKSSLAAQAFRVLGWFGLGLIAVAVFLSDFLARNPAGALWSGAALSPPSPEHPFGTDLIGRDLYSETLHGLAHTAWSAAAAVLIAILFGSLFGIVAARLPRPLPGLFRLVMGIFAAVPALLLTILMIGLTGHGFAPLAAGLAAAPLGFVRAFDRADLTSRHADYAQSTGIPGTTLLQRDLNYDFRRRLGTVLARALAAVTILISTASFLGFGAVPPARDLGLMIAAGKASYLNAWWTVAFPAAALVLLVLCSRLAAGLEEGERA